MPRFSLQESKIGALSGIRTQVSFLSEARATSLRQHSTSPAARPEGSLLPRLPSALDHYAKRAFRLCDLALNASRNRTVVLGAIGPSSVASVCLRVAPHNLRFSFHRDQPSFFEEDFLSIERDQRDVIDTKHNPGELLEVFGA